MTAQIPAVPPGQADRSVPESVVFADTVSAGRTRIPVITAEILTIAASGLLVGWRSWPLGIIVAGAVGAWLIQQMGSTGSNAIRAAAQIRTVDRRTGLPAGWRAVIPGRTTSLDIRSGRDPLKVIPAGNMWSGPRPDRDPWASSVPQVGLALAVLEFDDGTRLDLTGPVVMGRRPPESVAGWTTVTVTDLSRTISRVHAGVSPRDGGVWVRDLGSANGTTVIEPGCAEVPVPNGHQIPVVFGTTMRLGARRIQVLDPAQADTGRILM